MQILGPKKSPELSKFNSKIFDDEKSKEIENNSLEEVSDNASDISSIMSLSDEINSVKDKNKDFSIKLDDSCNDPDVFKTLTSFNDLRSRFSKISDRSIKLEIQNIKTSIKEKYSEKSSLKLSKNNSEKNFEIRVRQLSKMSEFADQSIKNIGKKSNDFNTKSSSLFCQKNQLKDNQKYKLKKATTIEKELQKKLSNEDLISPQTGDQFLNECSKNRELKIPSTFENCDLISPIDNQNFKFNIESSEFIGMPKRDIFGQKAMLFPSSNKNTLLSLCKYSSKMPSEKLESIKESSFDSKYDKVIYEEEVPEEIDLLRRSKTFTKENKESLNLNDDEESFKSNFQNEVPFQRTSFKRSKSTPKLEKSLSKISNSKIDNKDMSETLSHFEFHDHKEFENDEESKISEIGKSFNENQENENFQIKQKNLQNLDKLSDLGSLNNLTQYMDPYMKISNKDSRISRDFMAIDNISFLREKKESKGSFFIAPASHQKKLSIDNFFQNLQKVLGNKNLEKIKGPWLEQQSVKNSVHLISPNKIKKLKKNPIHQSNPNILSFNSSMKKDFYQNIHKKRESLQNLPNFLHSHISKIQEDVFLDDNPENMNRNLEIIEKLLENKKNEEKFFSLKHGIKIKPRRSELISQGFSKQKNEGLDSPKNHVEFNPIFSIKKIENENENLMDDNYIQEGINYQDFLDLMKNKAGRNKEEDSNNLQNIKSETMLEEKEMKPKESINLITSSDLREDFKQEEFESSPKKTKLEIEELSDIIDEDTLANPLDNSSFGIYSQNQEEKIDDQSYSSENENSIGEEPFTLNFKEEMEKFDKRRLTKQEVLKMHSWCSSTHDIFSKSKNSSESNDSLSSSKFYQNESLRSSLSSIPLSSSKRSFVKMNSQYSNENDFDVEEDNPIIILKKSRQQKKKSKNKIKRISNDPFADNNEIRKSDLGKMFLTSDNQNLHIKNANKIFMNEKLTSVKKIKKNCLNPTCNNNWGSVLKKKVSRKVRKNSLDWSKIKTEKKKNLIDNEYSDQIKNNNYHLTNRDQLLSCHSRKRTSESIKTPNSLNQVFFNTKMQIKKKDSDKKLSSK